MTLPIRTITCEHCGLTFETKGTRSYLCRKCQNEKNRRDRLKIMNKKYAVIKQQNQANRRYIMVHDPLGEDGGIKPGALFPPAEVFRENRDGVPRKCWEPGTIFRLARDYFIVRYGKKENLFERLEAEEIKELKARGIIK